MLAAKLFDTPLIIVPGMDAATIEAEWNAMVERSRMTQRLIDGLIDWETFLDFMVQAGYEPAELLQQAEENLDFAIREGLEIER
ncbi:MAG: hypothetical protein HC827_12040 [Cyanobacteria bacterium RM1_2_2]|nr:hypothetical protein [Cyanobacteria bacterium RM1_2_2]